MGISITKETDGSNDESGGKRRFVITLSTSALIGLTTVILMGFVWVFVFGLMIGRGYQPEESMPKLKEIMPSKQAASVEADKPSSRKNNSSTKTQPSKKKDEVLKAEELNFFEQLKKKPEGYAPQKSTQVSKPKVQKPAAPIETTTNVAGATVYDYVYQVAAFRDMPPAKAFRDKITAKNYRADITSGTANGVTWHRIVVKFRGTANDTRKLKEFLRSLGVQKPFLKSKTEIRSQ